MEVSGWKCEKCGHENAVAKESVDSIAQLKLELERDPINGGMMLAVIIGVFIATVSLVVAIIKRVLWGI